MGIPFNPNPPATEGRFGWGTTEAVDSLLKTLNLTSDMTVMLAINLATMIRNAVSVKTLKAEDVANKVRAQMNAISNEIAEVCKMKWRDKQHHILFYLTEPEKAIPQQYRRVSDSPTKLVISSATVLLLKTLKNLDQTDGNVSAHVRLTDTMRVPSYKGLRIEIDKLTSPDVDLQLISHMPLDYHVTMLSGRNGFIYRSHTGEMVKMLPDVLGKMVFKKDFVPFYPITHMLLGDKYLMKGTMDTDTKKKFFQYAEQENWAMHTNTYVTTKIKKYNFHLSYDLN